MLHALHSAFLSHVSQPHRPLSKNKTKVLKISIIEGKYLGFRYLSLIFFVFIEVLFYLNFVEVA